MRTQIQKFGKALMGPLSIIVASGLFLGIVSILQNPSLVGEAFASTTIIQGVVVGVNNVVGMMFGLLPILFAISVATGLANDDKEVAAFSAVIGFFVFHVVIRYLLNLQGVTPDVTSVDYLLSTGKSQIEAFEIANAYDMVYGIFTYRMGIFGGILVGIWTSFIHNKYHTQKLPIAFSFFAGNRFVPIMMILTIPLVSIVTFYIWPYFSTGINGLGHVIGNTGNFGLFIYGFSERLLIPTGLHHILNQLIRFTQIGGTAVVDGESYSGALVIFNAALSSPVRDVETLRYATRFLTQGYHPFMLFGLPAATYAMYKTAYIKNRPKIKGMLIAAALTSFVTGITEPIEFAFIFISPVLWIFHAIMAGLSFVLMSLLNVSVGNAGGGMIDLTIFGILQGMYTRWYLVVLVGIAYAAIYYFVFTYFIKKHDIETPGREQETVENVAYEINDLGDAVLEAIGGKDNIVSIDNCISRLRLVLKDTKVVDEGKLKATGSMGIVKIDEANIQVVYGGRVEEVARALKNANK